MEEILYQLVDTVSHYLQGFIHPRWLARISEPSTVFLEVVLDEIMSRYYCQIFPRS